MDILGYTYSCYCDIYDRLDGKTIHWYDGLGYQEFSKVKLTNPQFYQKLHRIKELQDIEPSGPDEWEMHAYELADLRSDLFLLERLHPYHNTDEE